MSDQQNLETVGAIYAAFGAGDVPTILGHLDPDVQWDAVTSSAHDAGVPWLAARKGPDEVAEFFGVVAQMGIEAFEVRNVTAGNGEVAAYVYLRAGELVDEEVHWWTFGDDGKVVRFRHVCDTAAHAAEARRRGLI